MPSVTISTFQLFEMFPDQEAARVYFEKRLWPGGPRCPVCWQLVSSMWSSQWFVAYPGYGV
jgi:hypothetical protein